MYDKILNSIFLIEKLAVKCLLNTIGIGVQHQLPKPTQKF